MFIIEIPYLNLDQMYNSGQVFRWIKLRDSKYAIPVGGQVLKIEQNRQRFILSCTDAEFYDFWFRYFDLETDYAQLNYHIKNSDKQMVPLATRASGIRILRQDLFEVIVSSMLRKSEDIELLAQKCGTKHNTSMRENGRLTWYEFPTPDLVLERQDRLDDDLGWKDNLLQICEDILSGWLDFELLSSMTYKDAKEYLMEFDGIGSRIADCICLCGLHLTEAFPADKHVKQIMQKQFDCDDVEVFADWYLQDAKGYEGLVQQYLRYNNVVPPRPGELVMLEVENKKKRKRSK